MVIIGMLTPNKRFH